MLCCVYYLGLKAQAGSSDREKAVVLFWCDSGVVFVLFLCDLDAVFVVFLCDFGALFVPFWWVFGAVFHINRTETAQIPGKGKRWWSDRSLKCNGPLG